MRPRNRPRKPTECLPMLIHAISQGASYKMACAYAGLAESTFHKEMATARTGEDLEAVQFSEQVKKAEAEAGLRWLGQIEKAANEGNWQAAAWRLERRHPQEFARRSVNVLQISDMVEQDNGGSLDETIKEALALVARAMQGKNKDAAAKYLLAQIEDQGDEE